MARERLHRTEAIVLRERDYGEADRILELMTPIGRVTGLARGVRRPTSRKAGHLGLFCRSSVMLAHGRNMQTVTQAESMETYEGLRGDLLRFTYACYASELVLAFSRVEDESEEGGALYDLMRSGLRWFSTEDDLRLWMRYFELSILDLAGFRPELFRCVSCSRAIMPEPNYLSLDDGGLVCSRCATNNPRALPASIDGQKVLRYLQTTGEAKVRPLRLQESTHREIESLLHRYLEHTLERELRSASFLKRIRHELHLAESRGRGRDRASVRPADGAVPL